MTERTWSQSADDATEPTGTLILAQAEATSELAPTGPLTPTGPLAPTQLVPEVIEAAPEPAETVAAPQGLVEVEETLGEPETVATPQLEPNTIEVAPLAAGERRVVDVPAGGLVSLGDAAFDPSVAIYSVDGNDLIVTLANGAVLVLTNFFAPSEVPTQLSVLYGPPTPAVDLLAQAEEVAEVETTAPPVPPGGQEVGEPIRSGAPFSPYDQGTIGSGLDVLGPLGPTELAFGLDTPELNPIEFIDDGEGDGNGPVETAAPQVTLRSTIEATIGEVTGPGFNPVETPVLPLDASALIPDNVDREGLTYTQWLQSRARPSLDPDQINSINPGNLTLDIERELFIRYLNEDSYSIDSLFVHEVAADGSIVNARAVFPGVNNPGDALSDITALQPGTEVSLGKVAAGTQLGFILLNDGFRVNDFANLQGGRFEVRNPTTGEIAKITDTHSFGEPLGNPQIVHVADDGTVTVLRGQRFFSADPTPDSPNANPLNPTGQGHYISGWDDEEGVLIVGIDDGIGRFRDETFSDIVFSVRFGSPTEKVLVIKGGDAGLDAVITDEDSTSMVAATIALAGLEGDRLVIDPAVLAGTGIALTQVSDTRIDLSGESLIENYEAVISAATIEIDLAAGRVGERTIDVIVEDPDGNTGSASSTFVVDDNLLTGPGDGDDAGSGDDIIVGTTTTDPVTGGRDVISGRGGDDTIDGRSGDDFIDGGDGRDTIIVRGPGDNIISGGPQPDLIILSTMPGVDTVRITGLADGKDTIRNFNATDGDQLDLSGLFRDVDIDAASFAGFVRTQQHEKDVVVQVDLDGPGTAHRFVDIALLVQPVGVTAATDPASYIIVGDPESQVA